MAGGKTKEKEDEVTGRAAYVLFILMLANLTRQMAMFSLVASNKSMAADIGYGERDCVVKNNSAISAIIQDTNTTADQFCQEHTYLCEIDGDDDAGVMNTAPDADYPSIWGDAGTLCTWHYNGKGIEYQVLAGPAYIVLFAVSGVPMGLLCELNNLNRKWMLCACVMMWSLLTILTGFSTQFWHIAVARVLTGIFSAGGVPFSASLIGNYFSKKRRGAAMGFFFWGVYLGYSMTFVLIMAERSLGWRSVYFLTGAPGALLAVILMFTVREPSRDKLDSKEVLAQISGMLGKMREAARHFLSPTLLLLSLGGAVRNGAGIVWAYNIVLFFNEYQSGIKIEYWMSWMPLVFGSLGAFGGGALSDKLSANRGVRGRLIILIACLLLSAPFLVGVLYLPMPWAMIIHIPAYIIGEMWIGVCVAVVVDLVPSDLTASTVAVYLLIIQLIGGNWNLLATPLRLATDMRTAILILFPGMYVCAAILFALTLVVVTIRAPSRDTQTAVPMLTADGDEVK